MADKKPAPDKTTSSTADTELVQRVDAMMSPRQVPPPAPMSPTNAQDPSGPQRLDSDPAPLDIFAGLKTAPEVPKNLLKIIRSKPAKEQPAPEATKPEPAVVPVAAAEKPAVQAAPLASATPIAIDAPTEPDIPVRDIDVPPLAIDDAASDAAVNDIVAKEADTVLAAEDAKAGLTAPERTATKRVERQKTKQRRKLPKKLLLAIPIVLLIAVFAYPLSRYAILGLFLKQNLTIVVEDSSSQTPVTNADVTFRGVSATTDASGKAVLKAPVGPGVLSINKRYYQPLNRNVTLSELGGTALKLSLNATGRQVPVTLVNRLTDKPVANASITAAGITAKADAAGHATIVLPTKDDLQDAVIKAPGFNDLSAKIEVTAKDVPGNHLKLTPAGSVYFLSNLSGTIDVVKSNLDGSGRKTVLAGSGKEDKASTSLLASHDWKYVLLASKRNNGKMALFLINTANDKVTQFDQTAGEYRLIGWSGHNFVYDIVKSAVAASQSGHEVLKSYNADTQQLNQLDQTSVTGDSSSYAYETFNDINLIQKQLVYIVRWKVADGATVDLTGKQDIIRTVLTTGSGRKDLQQLDATTVADMQAVQPKPQVMAFAVTSSTDNSKTYYRFDAQTGSVVADNGAADLFSKPSPVYLPSPSGTQVLWADTQSGRSSILVGDQNAGSPVTVLSYTDFRPFAWFSDSYLLLRNADGEIYAASVQANPQPKKVTDYLKTTTITNEYGGL